MKFLRLLLMLLGMSVLSFAQAKFIQYQPTVKSMTVVTNGVEAYCMFWSRVSVFPPYTFEAACYYDKKFQWIMATIPGTTLTFAFNFSGGSISWMIAPAADGVSWNYSISGQELLLTPTLVVGTM